MYTGNISASGYFEGVDLAFGRYKVKKASILVYLSCENSRLIWVTLCNVRVTGSCPVPYY